jgi:uncharacterized protein DUF3606
MLPQKIKSAAGGVAISCDLSALPPLIVDSCTASDVKDEQAQQAYFRNSVDLRDKVEVRTLRKRLKLSPGEFKDVVRKAGNSISAISKEAGRP